jgi:hypothetical protein
MQNVDLDGKIKIKILCFANTLFWKWYLGLKKVKFTIFSLQIDRYGYIKNPEFYVDFKIVHLYLCQNTQTKFPENCFPSKVTSCN